MGVGYWDFAFGFNLASNYVSAALPYVLPLSDASVTASCIGAFPNSSTSVQVTTSDCNGNPQQTSFTLVIY